MRALGPGSVSSILKVILDVVYVALWIGVGVLALLTLLAILLSFNPDVLANVGVRTPDGSEIENRGAVLISGNLARTVYAGVILAIVQRVRKIFATLTAGDPFHPDNVIRLRVIGLMLAAMELGRYAFRGLAAWMLPGENGLASGVSFTPWFSVLVVFVLAEVFREGARLRREAELTI